MKLEHINFMINALLAKDAAGAPLLMVSIRDSKLAGEVLETLETMRKELLPDSPAANVTPIKQDKPL